MKRSSILFLQVVVVLTGIGALALMLWEPHLEGRNANATLYDIYFKDPFLACAYVASIPFFIILCQAFRLLRFIGQDKAFSQAAIKSLRTIRYCAIMLVAFVAAGVIFIMLNNSGDDPAGGVFIGLLIATGSIVIGVSARVFERILQNRAELNSGYKRQQNIDFQTK